MVTEQVADAPVPAKVQLPRGVTETVPVGAVGSFTVSVTVAVQLVAWLTTTVDGAQLTVVEVMCIDVTLASLDREPSPALFKAETW